MIIINGGSYWPDSKEIDQLLLNNIKIDDLITFVPAATTRSQASYFEFFKEKMSNYGLKNINWIDLYGPWEKKVDGTKVIYLAGGNTYKLIDVIRKSNFDTFLKRNRDDLIICGNSAGAVVLGESVLTTNDEDVIGIEDSGGLGLIPYSICPHYNKEKKKRLEALARKNNLNILGVPETSGILFNSDEKRVGSIAEIFPGAIE